MTANAVIPAGGFEWKTQVKAATTGGNINLSGGAPNILDGVSLTVGDRILVKDQTLPAQNGIYVVQVVGSGANGTWVRALDCANPAGLVAFTVPVTNGTLNGGKAWYNATPPPIVVGVTAINVQPFGQGSGGGSSPQDIMRFAGLGSSVG